MGLSARNLARLEILAPLAKKGRLAPDSAEAREYARLREAEEKGVDLVEEEPAVEPAPSALALGTVAEQAEFYGVSKRTINIWRGKNAPLGRPVEMVAWWAKAYPGQSINPKIVSALARTGGEVSAPVVAAAPVVPAEAPAVTGVGLAEASGDVGFDSTHRRMLEEEVRLYDRIKSLEAQGRVAEADTLRPAWLNLSTSLGAADTRQIRNAMQRGDLIPRSVIEKEFSSLMAHHPEVIRSELKAWRTSLEPVPPAHIWEPLVDQFCDGLFSALPDKLLGRATPEMAA